MDFDPRSLDESRDRDIDGRELNQGSRGGLSNPRERERLDPRDVFTRDLELPRGRERKRVRTMATGGAFRVVPAGDLRDGDDRPLDPHRGDLRHLKDSGLVDTVPAGADDRALVVLTERGRDVLERNRWSTVHAEELRCEAIDREYGRIPDDGRSREARPQQEFHVGIRSFRHTRFAVHRPRELMHDAQVYRAYLKEAERLRGDGASIRRVVLDHELKREYQQFLQERNRGKAANTRSEAETALANLDTQAAAIRGQLTAINRPGLEHRLHQATSNPVFELPDGPLLDLAAAKATVERLQQQLDRCTNDLNHSRGQLHLISGHVGTERLAQQQEAVDLAHAEVLERERAERAALRLLREIESAEAERATHLGRALAGPITEAFRALTEGRYGTISLAPGLRAEHVEADGGTRALEHVSVGAREQLATLLRLAVAGYLQTAIILDDQLVHSDSGRLAWFKRCLRDSSRTHNHQVIVFTCRPGDYLGLPDADDVVTAVDLTAMVS